MLHLSVVPNWFFQIQCVGSNVHQISTYADESVMNLLLNDLVSNSSAAEVALPSLSINSVVVLTANSEQELSQKLKICSEEGGSFCPNFQDPDFGYFTHNPHVLKNTRICRFFH